MVVATEKLPQNIDELNFSLPEVLIIPDMLTDEQTRRRAAEFIGAAVNGVTLEIVPVKQSIGSLYEAIQLAPSGEASATALITANAKTDVIERTIKTGHVMDPVLLSLTDKTLEQHGQSVEGVQANSLRYGAKHPVIRTRTEAETRNTFRMKEKHAEGFFDEYNMFVISRAENLPEAGFFTETMSCCLQVISLHDDGLMIESAFVSGIAAPGEAAHDEATVIAMGQKLGVNLMGKNPAGIIDTPLFVRKDLMPNGVIDLVKIFDDCAGGTFFGEWKPRQDYLEYRAKCRVREEGFAVKVDQIVAELIAEAPRISSPVMAVNRLHRISEAHMVEKAVMDSTIDPRVFGNVAANHILIARRAADRGDWEKLDHNLKYAKSTAQSSSCPDGSMDMTDGGEETASDEAESDKECDFISLECPLCKKKNVKTHVTKTHISGDCGCSIRRK